MNYPFSLFSILSQYRKMKRLGSDSNSDPEEHNCSSFRDKNGNEWTTGSFESSNNTTLFRENILNHISP